MNETKMNHAIIVTIVYKVRMYNGKQNCCLIRTNFSYFLNDGSIYIVYDPMRLLFTARLLHFLRHLCDYQINNYGMISKIFGVLAEIELKTLFGDDFIILVCQFN